jgi:hypothetical protein
VPTRKGQSRRFSAVHEAMRVTRQRLCHLLGCFLAMRRVCRTRYISARCRSWPTQRGLRARAFSAELGVWGRLVPCVRAPASGESRPPSAGAAPPRRAGPPGAVHWPGFPQPDLMHQRRGLQRLAGRFVGHLRAPRACAIPGKTAVAVPRRPWGRPVGQPREYG